MDSVVECVTHISKVHYKDQELCEVSKKGTFFSNIHLITKKQWKDIGNKMGWKM